MQDQSSVMHKWVGINEIEVHASKENKMPETVEGFLKRASAAGIYELWASIGRDGQSKLLMLHLSPTAANAQAASAAGIVTRSFYVDGDYVLAADEQQTFAEALMHSAMSDSQKLGWLYTTLREYEDRLLNGELVEAKPATAPEAIS